MKYEALFRYRVPDARQAYRRRDAVIYALSVGAAHFAERSRGLDFLIDTRGPAVLPWFAVDLGHPGFWLADPATTVDATRVLHAEESIAILEPLPAEAEVIGRTRVVDVVDKGPGKGTLLYIVKDVVEAATSRPLARVERTVLLRGDGGYDGPSGPARPARSFPETPPDLVEIVPTLASQALLYRLNGDPNPLHVDPEAARRAGFEKPILHGLCTFGIAATAALFALADGDASRVRGFRARFSAPVWPGESLRIEIWRSGAVRAFAESRATPVLTFGQIDIAAD